MKSNKQIARLAGLLYLIIVIFGIIYLRYAPSKLIVFGDGSATFKNIIASEQLFRFSILSEIICGIFFLILAVVLYSLLKEVNKIHALLMVLFVVVSVSIGFVNLTNKFAVLNLVSKVDHLSLVRMEDMQSQVLKYLEFYDNGNFLGEIFWGLWLFPFGYLVFKSRFLPKILGIFLMAGCLGYLTDFVGNFLVSHFNEMTIGNYVTLPASIGEIGVCLWLLIMGTKDRKQSLALS